MTWIRLGLLPALLATLIVVLELRNGRSTLAVLWGMAALFFWITFVYRKRRA